MKKLLCLVLLLVLAGCVPVGIRTSNMYAGCVAGSAFA